jgi:hypothetical protein
MLGCGGGGGGWLFEFVRAARDGYRRCAGVRAASAARIVAPGRLGRVHLAQQGEGLLLPLYSSGEQGPN